MDSNTSSDATIIDTSAPPAQATTASPVTLSKLEQWIQSAFFYFFLSGVASNVCSWLITITIWRTKQLRTRFFIIVAFLMLSRALVNVMGLSSGMYRMLRTAGLIGSDFRRIVCISIHFSLYFCWTIEMSILCTLVIDRMLAIVAVSFYRKLSRRSAVYMCLAQYLVIALIKVIPTLTIDPLMEVTTCVNMYAPINFAFGQFSQYIDFAIAILIIILYAALISYIRVKVTSRSADTGTLNVTLERQLKLIPVLRNLVLVHFGLMFPGKLLNMMASIVPPSYQQRMVAYGGMILNVDIFVNAIMLLVTNADIRHAALPCCRKDKSQVSPSTLAASQEKSGVQQGGFRRVSVQKTQMVTAHG